MAYNTAELRLLTDRLVGEGQNHWVYDDTAAIATVIAAGYISDALKSLAVARGGRGMQIGDRVTYRRWTDLAAKTTAANLTSISEHIVTAVASSGATLSAAAGNYRPIVEDGAAVTLVAGQSGALCIFDKTDGALFTLPAAVPGLEFEFCVNVVVSSGVAKVITATPASEFVVGTVNAIVTGADADLAADAANGTTHVAISMNGTTTGGIAGTNFKLVCRTAGQWNILGTVIKSGSVATSFATS